MIFIKLSPVTVTSAALILPRATPESVIVDLLTALSESLQKTKSV
ncbi:hypothetical protein MKX79_04080 [Viridibacillus sp. FSL R5-0468]